MSTVRVAGAARHARRFEQDRGKLFAEYLRPAVSGLCAHDREYAKRLALIRAISRAGSQTIDAVDAVVLGVSTRSIQLHGKVNIKQLLESFPAMQTRWMTVVSSVEQGTDRTPKASAEMASRNHDLAAQTERNALQLAKVVQEFSK